MTLCVPAFYWGPADRLSACTEITVFFMLPRPMTLTMLSKSLSHDLPPSQLHTLFALLVLELYDAPLAVAYGYRRGILVTAPPPGPNNAAGTRRKERAWLIRTVCVLRTLEIYRGSRQPPPHTHTQNSAPIPIVTSEILMNTRWTSRSFFSYTQYFMELAVRCQRPSWCSDLSPSELESISRLRCPCPWVSGGLAWVWLWAGLSERRRGLRQRVERTLVIRISVGVLFDGFNSCPQYLAVLPAGVHIPRVSLIHADFTVLIYANPVHIPLVFFSPSRFQLFSFMFFDILYPLRNFISISESIGTLLLTFHWHFPSGSGVFSHIIQVFLDGISKLFELGVNKCLQYIMFSNYEN